MTQDANTGGFVLARSTSHLLHRAQQLAGDQFALAMGPAGITLRQFALLAALHDMADQTQSDLVRATGIDRSTLADMITRMEKRGLVARQVAENDARAKTVRLTTAGGRTYRQALPHALAADAALLDCLNKSRRAPFLEALQILALIAGQPDAAPTKKSKAAKVIRAAVKATKKQAKRTVVANLTQSAAAAKPAEDTGKKAVKAAKKKAKAAKAAIARTSQKLVDDKKAKPKKS